MTKESILSQTDGGLAVFKHYIPNLTLGKNFKNPFYEDTKASCSLYYDKKSRLYKLKDFGNPSYGGDCFAFVGQIKQLDCRRDFKAILHIISQALGITASTSYSIPKVKPIVEATGQESSSKLLPPVKKDFSAAELLFWEKYGIRRASLTTFNVSSIAELSGVSKEGKPYTYPSTEQEPIFAYHVGKQVKYYRPFSKQRFLYGGEKSNAYVFGIDQLPSKGEILFITGGEKDVMSLYERGLPAICFNSETSSIPLRTVKNLSYCFKHLVLLYDCDKTGVEAASRHQEALKQYGVKRLLLPLSGSKQEKDVSDYFVLGYTRSDLLRLFLSSLAGAYENTFAQLKSCAVDWNNPPIRPEPFITINGVVVASPANLLSISGSEGSGKSNYAGAIIAGALNTAGEAIDTLGASVSPNSEGKAVLVYDTEQSEDQLYRNMCSVLRRASLSKPPPWFKVFSIGTISRKERMRVVAESIDTFFYLFGGVHLVVIDGIADLVTSVNDEGESVLLVEELHRLAGFYKTCIMVVLHLSPSGYKLRGHLGSEIQRKASGILSIEKSELTGNSVVKAIKVREGNPMDIPQLQFAWDSFIGYHMLVDGGSEQAKKPNLPELIQQLSATSSQYTYTELCEVIQQKLEVKERQAKNYIKLLKEQGLITQNSSINTKYSLKIR